MTIRPTPSSTIPVVELDGFHGHLLEYSDARNPQTRVGGAARLSSEIQRKREDAGDILLLSGGDFFQGPPIATEYDGEPVIRVMNHDRFDAMTLGNHDFDKGHEVLAQRIAEAEFPVLAANLLEARSGRFVGHTDHPLRGVRQYAIKELGGARVAVIGLMKPDTDRWTHRDNVVGLAFEDPGRTVERLVPELMAREKPDVIVLHYQLLQQAPDLARRAREAALEATGRAPFVLVVGGHNYPEYAEPVADGQTMIVEGTDRGAHLNELDLRFDPRARRVVGHQFRRVPIDESVKPDPEVQAMVDRYRAGLDRSLEATVAVAGTPLTRSRHTDSPLGNLVTDCLREACGTDFAFVAGGSIKGDLPAGPLTLGEVKAALPFENRVAVLEMTGREVKKVLDESASRRGGDKVLQMSGLEMAYDPEAPSAGRVLSCRLADGRPLEDDRVYRVAADDFLCAGGDSYTAFATGRLAVVGRPVREVVVEEMQKRQVVRGEAEGRIRLASRVPGSGPS